MKIISKDAQMALSFFASPAERKLDCLAQVRWPRSFVLNENGEVTKLPLVAVTYRFMQLIERDIAEHFSAITRRDKNLYHELSALTELIIAHRDDYSYMWYLDKTAAGVSGFADHLWSTVQRLALAVLEVLAVDPSKIKIDLLSLVPKVETSNAGRAVVGKKVKKKS